MVPVCRQNPFRLRLMFPLASDTISDDDCDGSIDDEPITSQYARLFWADKGRCYKVEDLGATNGSWLGEQKFIKFRAVSVKTDATLVLNTVALLYGRFMHNILPKFKCYKRVSWEGYLSGLLAGMGADSLIRQYCVKQEYYVAEKMAV